MSPLVKEAAKTEMAQAITAGWKKKSLCTFFYVLERELLTGGPFGPGNPVGP